MAVCMGSRASRVSAVGSLVASLPSVKALVAAGAFLAMVSFFAVPAAAAPKWFDTAYDYVVLDQDVRTALTEFGRNLGLPIVLSDAVSGRVRGRIEAKSAGEFLDRLSGANGLVWYFDGSVLHVSADREFVTRVLDAGRLSGKEVARQMQEFGLADERFSLRATPSGHVIIVSGPPAYINVVEQLVERMQPEPLVAADDLHVRVFRGGVMTEVVVARPEDADQSGSDKENAVRKERVARP